MDVVSKEGLLFLQGVKFGKKIWRKCWLILFEPSPAGIGRMEMYDVRDGGIMSRPRKGDKRVIRLADCLSITPAPGESCPTDCSAFFLNTVSCTYTIAAPTREDWISTLCRLAFQKSQASDDPRKGQKDKYGVLTDNDLYSTWGAGQFQVTVQSSDASQRCRISGSYLLSAEKDAICLLDLKTGQAIYRWPYRLLRRFGQVKGGIMIEAGRRCNTGEGQFVFLSKQGSQIHRAIEEAIMHQSVQELLAQATASQPSPQDRPPVKKPPPVSVSQERPRAPLKCKKGQQLHKAIEEALAHQSIKELPPLPTSAKPKTQTGINKYFQTKKEKPCPPALPVHRAVDAAPKHLNDHPPSPPPPLPPPLPKNKPQDRPRPNAPKQPTARDKDKSWATPRRNISLPDPPPKCMKSPLKSPDEVLYSVIFPQPKPRASVGLPKVPTPPSLPQHFQMNPEPEVNVQKEQKSAAEASGRSEASDDDPPYTNWTVKSSDESNIKDLYSTVDFAAKRRNRGNENSDRQEPTSVVTSNEMPVDFKQTLSSVLFKDVSKIPTLFPPKSLRSSCNRLDTTDELMTE